MRALRVLGPAVLVAVAAAALIVALAYGGGASAPLLHDPGAGVRWGLPIAKLLVNLGAAGTIGALVLAVFALGREQRVIDAVMDAAAGSAALFTVAGAVTGLLTYVDVTGVPISTSKQFGDGLASFLTSVSLGQAWLWTTLIAAAITAFCFAVRGRGGIVVLAALAVAALIPMAQQGHAAGTSGHDLAVASLGLHLAFAAVWIGGLVTLVLLHRMLAGPGLVAAVERYSSIAAVCFVVVAVSGYFSAELRIGSLANLATPYGILVLIKVLALVALGLFGLLQRRWLIERMRVAASAATCTSRGPAGQHARGPFWWMVLAELAFMGVASGVAAALARTATPVAQTITSTGTATPAEILTGEPLPAAADPTRLALGIHVDPIWLLAAAFAAFFYLAGVWRLRRAGERWPIGRTISWLVGLVLLVWVTDGGIAIYQKTLISAHLTVFVTVALLVPVLLVPAMPITLGLRSIRPRTDDSTGVREWMLALVAPRPGTLLGRVRMLLARPVVTAALLIASLWVWLTTLVLDWSVTDPIGYHLCLAWMLVAGYLFVQSVVGRDPMPYRAAYPVRLIVLAVVVVSHLVLGLVVGLRHGLWMAGWFAAMGRTWGPGAIADQQLGGWIALAIGLASAAALVVGVVVMWSRASGGAQRTDVKHGRVQ